jgi:hypothetical protein
MLDICLEHRSESVNLYLESSSSQAGESITVPVTKMPTVVCHADWGTSPHKRWIARADLDSGHYEVRAPELVGDHLMLISRVRDDVAEAGSVLFGFDFPIGIPAAYAASIRVTNFKEFLIKLGSKEWAQFYSVCAKASEITKYCPFYPFRPGGTCHKHLLSALGVKCIDDLRRQCELETAERNAACPLFWTLGANQVGKGAIVGWRDVIVPALADATVKLWPFDGVLDHLLLPGNLVVAETYPAEACRWLLGRPLKGKGKLDVRKSASTALVSWAQRRGVRLHSNLKQVIEQGVPNGDDAFDAVIGLFGMLEVVLGHRATGEPIDKAVRDIEGWILGQVAPESSNADC